MVKRFTLILSAALLAAGAAIAAPHAPKAVNVNDVKAKIEAKQKLVKDHKPMQTKAPITGLPIQEVITNPEGELKIYSKNEGGYYYGDQYYSTELAAKVVFGDNNEVYIQDPMSFGWEGYIKGILSDGVITVSLPQTILDAGWYGVDVVVYKTVEGSSEDDVDFTYASSVRSVDYLYDSETGDIELSLPGDEYEYALGLIYTDDLTDLGIFDYEQIYTPFTGEITSLPEGLETQEFTMYDGVYGHSVNVAITEDNLYIQGLSALMPESVICANLNGNEAIIPQDQIIGTYYSYFIQTKVFLLAESDDPEDPGYYYVFGPETMEYKLNVDLENKFISSAVDPVSTPVTEWPLLALNASATQPYALEIYDYFKIYIQDSYAGVPQNPYNLFLDDSYANYGVYVFDFFIPNLSKDATVLNDADLYYRIYLDDEVYAFEADDENEVYPDVDGTMVDVPFLFSNDWDIFPYEATERIVYIYMEGFDTISVQSVYKYNGEWTTSDLVTLDVQSGEETTSPSGVNSISAAPVVSEVYYDLNGRKVANPAKGIFIKKATHADGKVVTTKVVKR